MRLNPEFLGGAPVSTQRKQPLHKAASIFILTIILGVSAMGVTAACAQTAMCWIEVKPAPSGNIVQIIGHASSPEAVNGVDFTFAIRRQNGGNNSKTRQAGRFDLAPGESKALATTAINVEPGDNLMIELTIKEKSGATFQATLSSTPVPKGQSL